jgi:hypothetical protein
MVYCLNVIYIYVPYMQQYKVSNIWIVPTVPILKFICSKNSTERENMVTKEVSTSHTTYWNTEPHKHTLPKQIKSRGMSF